MQPPAAKDLQSMLLIINYNQCDRPVPETAWHEEPMLGHVLECDEQLPQLTSRADPWFVTSSLASLHSLWNLLK